MHILRTSNYISKYSFEEKNHKYTPKLLKGIYCSDNYNKTTKKPNLKPISVFQALFITFVTFTDPYTSCIDLPLLSQVMIFI